MNTCINIRMCGGLAINLSILFTIHAGETRFHSYRTQKYLRFLAKNEGGEKWKENASFFNKTIQLFEENL